MGPRVCVLTSVHKPNSNRIFYRQCRTLARAGYEVTLIGPATYVEEIRDGVRVLGVPPPSSRWHRPRTWVALLRQAVRLQPDVVHFHDPELLAIVPLLRLSLGRGVRIVYDVHEYVIDSIAHKVWIPASLRDPTAWLAGRVEGTLGRAVDGLVLVVEEQGPLYQNWAADRAIVHNYPEAAAFADPIPLPEFPADRFRLIYLGSLYARRGIMTMLQALSLVVREVPETLLILGGAFETESFRAQVEAYIAEHDLDRHVVFLDWVEHSHLKNYLASADVAWLPGLWVKQYQRRSISTKLLECMLMGLPIVSSDHPHRRQFISEAQCGFSVTADDPHAHAQAILQLQRDRGERQAMGERARELILRKYTWETEAEVLLAYYERLLRKGEG